MRYVTPVADVRNGMIKLKSLIDSAKVTNLGLAVKKVGMSNFLYTTALSQCGFVHKNGDGAYKWSGPITPDRVAKAMNCVRKLQRAGEATKKARKIHKAKVQAKAQAQAQQIQQAQSSDSAIASIAADISEIKREFNVMKVVLYNLQNSGVV